MLSQNTVLRERYRILHELGRGGMGAVYQALDEHLSCVVAVKETFAKTEERRRAFRREAELLANLSHPTLPRVMDHFTQGDGQFLVMQFVPGHDLAELIDLAGQPFAVTEVLHWADQLLDALEELHSSNPPIIHRDIKPSNLKVTPRGRILLLDFGLAKGFAGQMSTAGVGSHGKSIYGYTPNYASIEQIRGAGTDPRSDIYSLGATLWTLLTGKVPPDAVTRMAEKEEGNSDPLATAHEMNKRVPESVWSVLNQALAVNRNQRYASAADMRRALGAARDKAVDHPRVLLEDQGRGSSSIPYLEARQINSTTEASEPAVGPELLRPVASTTNSPQSEVLKPVSTREPIETLSVDALPNVVAWNERFAPQTVVSTPAQEISAKSGRNLPLIFAASAIVAVVVVGLAVWRPWSAHQPSSENQPTQTNKRVTSTTTPVRNQFGMELVLIPAGSFTMGSSNGGADEKPSHQVTISYSFYMGKYEVTQGQWRAVMGTSVSQQRDKSNTSWSLIGEGDNYPMYYVSWNEAQEFLQKLNQMNDGYTYRLPTEAEWEYACRGGTTSDYAGTLDAMAWYGNNSGEHYLDAAGIFRTDRSNYSKRLEANKVQTHPVGMKQPNSFGLYDMHGNVWEWCQDWYHRNYNEAPADGSAWVSGRDQKYRVAPGGNPRVSGSDQKYRVMRGGSLGVIALFVRSAMRYYVTPDFRDMDIDLRVVATVRTQ